MRLILMMSALIATLGLGAVGAQASSLIGTSTTELCQTDGSETYCQVVDDGEEPDILGMLGEDLDDDD